MALTLSGVLSKLNEEEKELNRAIAKIALLKGINTAERRQIALREREIAQLKQTCSVVREERKV